ALVYPGEAIDPRGEFFPFAPPFAYRAGGRFLAGFAPAMSALSVIPLMGLGRRGLVVLPLVSTIAVLVVLRRLCQSLGFGRGLTLATVAITALASPIPFYAMVFWEHSLFTLAALAAIAAVVPARSPGPRSMALAGLLVASACALRTEGYVLGF